MPYPEGEHLSKVCMLGCGMAECRYLALCGGSVIEGYRYSCEKRSPLRKYIDSEVALGRQRESGDNCEGLDWR